MRNRGDTKACFALLGRIIKDNPQHVDAMAVYARLQVCTKPTTFQSISLSPEP